MILGFKEMQVICGSQGWEFAHCFFLQIARFFAKKERMSNSFKKMSDLLIFSFLMSDSLTVAHFLVSDLLTVAHFW